MAWSDTSYICKVCDALRPMNDMQSEKPRDRLIAIHEAGHAVVCYLLGYDFESVTIIPNPILESDGAFKRSITKMPLETRNLDSDQRREWLKDQITIIFSGAAAVHKYCSTENPAELGIGPDLISAKSLANMITDSDTEILQIFTLLSAKARRLVTENRNWLAISFLADNLIEKKFINYSEAKKVIVKGLISDGDASEK